MQLNVNAQHIGQMLNADVINMDHLSLLSEADRVKLATDLIARLQASASILPSTPAATKPATAAEITHETTALAKALSDKEVTASDKKDKLSKYLKFLKDSLGDVTDVVLNAVKIAQVLGLG